MKALITGIRGAAGSYLATHLRKLGVQVVGLARPECDLTRFTQVRELLLAEMPDVIYHLASKADVRRSFDEPEEIFANNAGGSVTLFEAIRSIFRGGAPAWHPIINVCSTSEVYGEPGRIPIDETSPVRPTNPYAGSKTAADIWAQMYARCYGIRVVITRAFGYINPRRQDLALSNFARQIAAIERGEAEEIKHGNLDSVRTFCDVRDIVEAYALATDLPPVAAPHFSGIYNIGATEPISIGRCLSLLCEMARVPIRTRLDPALTRPADVTYQIPDTRRFRAMTGWQPKIPLRESLSWLLEHYRNGAI